MISGQSHQDPEHADWICPSDRQLALRAKLKAGWSVRSQHACSSVNNSKLTEVELKHMQDVISRAESLELSEQKRVGTLVHRLDSIKSKAIGDGQECCILCGIELGKFIGSSYIVCTDCRKNVCGKCSVEYKPHTTRSSAQRTSSRRTVTSEWLCKICSERREVWKRSGAWFFRSLPKYVLPETPPVTSTHRYQQIPPFGKQLSMQRKRSSKSLMHAPPAHTYEHRVIGRRRSSSSDTSDADDNTFLSSTWKRPNKRGDLDVPNMTSSTSMTSSLETSSPRSARQRSPLAARSYSDDMAGSHRSRTHSSNRRVSRLVSQKNVTSDTDCSASRSNDVTPERSPPLLRHSADTSGLHSSAASRKQEVDASLRNGRPSEKTHPEGPLGTIEFSIVYQPQKYALHVNLIRARNLRSMDINGFSDPYVKLHLFPGVKKATKMRTKTMRRTLNPDFRETLTYWGITELDMERKKLRLMVLDEDTFGTNEFIGEVLVQLRNLEPNIERSYDMALDYHQRTKEDGDSERGRLFIGLCYEQRNSILVVTIQRCSGLMRGGRNHSIDPQVKACLQLDDSSSNEVVCRKTDRKKATRSPNPAFCEEMRLPVPGPIKDLSRCRLDVSVWDKGVIGRDHLIGAIVFGITSKGDKLRHWVSCIKNPSQKQEMWHTLIYPEDPEKLAALSAAGKRRRTPRISRKFAST